MNKNDKRGLLRGLFLGILAGTAAASLAGCAAGEGYGFRPGVLAGVTRSTGTADGESLSGDGGAVAIRGEVTKRVDYLPDAEVGLRAQVGGLDSDADADGVPVHAEAGELALSGVLRGFVPIDHDLRLYFEGSLGYAHDWGTVTGGPVRAEGDGGGIMAGLGAGVEFRGAYLGLDWSQRSFDIDEVSMDADSFMLVVGYTVRF